MMAEPPQTIKEDFMSKREFPPEEIAESLEVCQNTGIGCTGCVLDEHPDYSDVEIFCRCDLEKMAVAAIKELLEENKRLREEARWIPVTERLPDEELEAEPKDADGKPLLGGYECIAQIEGAKRPTALWYCRIDGEGVWTDESGENFYPVTHWKPMPKGPEAE